MDHSIHITDANQTKLNVIFQNWLVAIRSWLWRYTKLRTYDKIINNVSLPAYQDFMARSIQRLKPRKLPAIFRRKSQISYFKKMNRGHLSNKITPYCWT